MHHVSYLRNSMAHSSKPSLAECVAGVAVMCEVKHDFKTSDTVRGSEREKGEGWT